MFVYGKSLRPGLLAMLSVPALWMAQLAPASDAGMAAADQVSEISYIDFMDNWLYTHAGDNRGYGPEHDLARDNILNHFNSLGLQTSLHPFTFTAGSTYSGANNVIGVLPGAATPGQLVIIGGHYDSDDNPGADDNASGTAGVMEAARVMSQYSFDHSLMFVAWDGEEKGLVKELAMRFERFVNKRLGRGHVKVHVAIFPVARNQWRRDDRGYHCHQTSRRQPIARERNQDRVCHH